MKILDHSLGLKSKIDNNNQYQLEVVLNARLSRNK